MMIIYLISLPFLNSDYVVNVFKYISFACIQLVGVCMFLFKCSTINYVLVSLLIFENSINLTPMIEEIINKNY